MSDRDYLFAGGELSDFLHARSSSVKTLVDQIPRDQFVSSADDRLIDYFVSQLYLEPITIHSEAISMTQPKETKVDVSGDRGRYFSSDRRGPAYIDGVAVELHIPYTGNRELLTLKPSQRYMGNAPSGKVNVSRENPLAGEIIIACSFPSDIGREEIGARIKTHFDSERNMIIEYATWSSKDVATYNASLISLITPVVMQRRKYIEQIDGLVAMLDIPIKENHDAPAVVPIHLRPHIVVQLPPPPKSGVRAEPGISKDLYERILTIIRHEARTYETAPETFNQLQEEQLRDILLSHLNGHFHGAATAEAFRKKGKTDIRIEVSDRSAFVAECKVWSGQSQTKKALEQLLDYLIWRDCKAAIIIFNKDVGGFSTLLDKVPAALEEHELFVKKSPPQPAGEWRYNFKSREDAGREVTVQVFLVNIFIDKTVRKPS